MDHFDDVYISLPEIWEANAALYPAKEALVCGNRGLDWATFNREMNRVANALCREGIGKGDRVAVLMSNSIENAIVMYGIVKSGACAVPLSPMLTSDQLATLLGDSGPSLAFFSEKTRALAEPIKDSIPTLAVDSWIAVDFEAEGWRKHDEFLGDASDDNLDITFEPNDDFIIIYSSGTTGLPKGILQSHYSRLDLAHTCAHEMRFDHQSRALTTTSLYSTGTSLIMLPTMLMGGTLVIMEQFSPQGLFAAVAQEGITHTFLVPAQFLMILADPQLDGSDLSSLQCMLSAGSPLRVETKQEIVKRIGPGLYELYGTSEGVATMMKPEQREGRLASAGPPMVGHRMKVVDNDGNLQPPGELGEIVGYSASMMKCYYGKPAETAAAIWRDEKGRSYFRTGDIGRMDVDQFVTIVDRKKDMIISGGFNVYPVDIEAIIGSHEAVFDVTVIGIPHPKWDETPLALVILRADVNVSEDELKEWTNQRLARHQRVHSVRFCQDFPRNALGRADKHSTFRDCRSPGARAAPDEAPAARPLLAIGRINRQRCGMSGMRTTTVEKQP